MDAGSDMDAATDMGSDAALDMSGDAAGDMAADMTTAPDMSTMDVGEDATPDVAAAEFFTFSGVVTLSGASDFGAVNVAISSNELNRQTFTNVDGAFSFAALPPNVYTISITFPGYLPIQDTVDLQGDASRNYSLSVGVEHALRLDVRFADSPPAEVAFLAQQGNLRRELVVPVSQGLAVWDQPLTEGSWVMTVSADGYRPTDVLVDLTADRQFNVMLTRAPDPTFSTSTDCACTSVARPASTPLLMAFGLFVAGWLIRRR
ncbi:MAG: carboxypeptidase regulatory-like domain-containing protein [bacterium]